MSVTREMIGAAHDILLKKEMVLSADLLASIYMAMSSRDAEVETLRQQLTEAQTCITEKTSYIDWLNGHCSDGWDKADELSGQLTDSQKREVMLRDALHAIAIEIATENLSAITVLKKCFRMADEALAATADLKDVILCHANPVAWIGQGLEPLVPEDLDKLRLQEPGLSTLYDTPLYRAWEPK